jgi:hypothetical protein
MVVAFASLYAGGCSKPARPPAESPGNRESPPEENATPRALTEKELMAKLSEFKDRMCACKDVKCAETVELDVSTWNREQTQKGPPNLSEDDQHRAMELQMERSGCARDLRFAP